MFDKLEPYIVIGIAQMFRLRPKPRNQFERLSIDALTDVAELAAKHGWGGILRGKLERVMSGCRGHHADELIEKWVQGDLPDFRKIAVRALGNMRLTRVSDVLWRVLQEHADESGTVHEALMALANVGGAENAQRLASRWASGAETSLDRLAIARVLAELPDHGEIRRLGRALLETDVSEPGWVYRAYGLTGDDSFVDDCRRGLHDRETSARATSSIALARLTGSASRTEVKRAAEEAGSALERCCSLVARLRASASSEEAYALVHELRAELQHESRNYHRYLRDDIIEILNSHGGTEGAMVASAYERLYAHCPEY
jgi:hypothetical protein